MVCIGSPARLVLDTNVALDWLIFDDPRFQKLRNALETSACTLVSDPLCLAELADVLGRPRMKIPAARQEAALLRYTSHADMIAWREPPAALPKCRDADDQMFLELAERSGATLLISRDYELLRLDHQMRRLYAVAVLGPVAAAQKLDL